MYKKRIRFMGIVPLAALIILTFFACTDNNNGQGILPETAEIIFVSNMDTGSERTEIYSIDSEGNYITRITNSEHNHFLIGINTSKRYIVATRGTEENKRLWVIDLNTGEEIPLTNEENSAEGRSFSQDGEWIVFWMVVNGEDYSDIYKIKRDGTRLTNLTNTPTSLEFDPCWSNDDTEISYSYYDSLRSRFILMAMDSNGENSREIYDHETSVTTLLFPPGLYDSSWSPDNQYLLVETPVLFTGEGENGHAGVWRILKINSVEGSHTDITGDGPYADSALYLPSFSPDGEYIVVTARSGPIDPGGTTLSIVKMNKDGSSPISLTDSSSHDQFAVWIKE